MVKFKEKKDSKYSILFKLTLASLITFPLVGCSPSSGITDEDKVGDAQFCLDDMPISGLSSSQRSEYIGGCLSKMDGVTNKQSNLIRCASGFLEEGFSDPSTLSTIVRSMGQQNSNSSTLLGVLAFKGRGASSSLSSIEDKNYVKEISEYCISAGNPGYVLISSISQMATTIASLGAGNDIQQGIANLLNNPSELANVSAEVIGPAAVVAYQTSCQTVDSSNQQVCSQLGNAINSGASTTDIGTALLNCWQTGSCSN